MKSANDYRCKLIIDYASSPGMHFNWINDAGILIYTCAFEEYERMRGEETFLLNDKFYNSRTEIERELEASNKANI